MPVVSDFSLTFFGAATSLMMSLGREGRSLVPRSEELRDMFSYTSGGTANVDLDLYDAIVIYGMGLQFLDILRLCRRYGTADHEQFGPVTTLLSRSCFTACAEEMLSQTLSLGILRQIRSVSEVPVLIVAVPFRPAHSRKGLKDDRLSDPEFLRLLYTQYQTVLRNLGSRMNFEPIWQDESTISEIGFTKSEFTLGAVTLDLLREGRERDDDLLHMNEHYGAIMLMNILRHLDVLVENPDGREAGGGLIDMLLPRHESFA